MIQPWNEATAPMFYSYTDQQNMRDYLIPNLLAFRAGLDEATRRKVQEIRIIRNSRTGCYISGRNIDVKIMVDEILETTPEVASTIKEKLNKFLTRLGLVPFIVVYDNNWLDSISNEAAVDEIKNNSLLVYKQGDPYCYITAKSCIDSYYENNTEYDGKHRSPHECDMLFEFITGFPLLSWGDMNSAIEEAPINYAGVDDFIYQTVVRHINIWIAENFLHTPKWLKDSNSHAPTFPYNSHCEFDRDSL